MPSSLQRLGLGLLLEEYRTSIPGQWENLAISVFGGSWVKPQSADATPAEATR